MQPAAVEIQVQHPEELAVGTGVGDHRAPTTRIGDDARHRHTVMRMTAENHVEPGGHRGQLQVDVHAVVRQQDDRRRVLAGADIVDQRLQLLARMPKVQFGIKRDGLAIGV